MRKYLYLSAVCVCMALCFVGCSKDDDEPGGKGAMYEVTIEQSGDFRSFIKSVVVVANGTRLKDGATGESLASPLILSDEELAVEKVTLTTTGKAIEFAVSGSVVDGEDGVVNEPMQWVVTVYKNGKEIEKKSLSFRDGKEIGMDDCKYSINSLVYWVTYVHNVVYSFYRSMIYCYINSTQRCAGSIVIDIIPTNGADKRKFFPFAPYFPVTNVIKRYFYPYFPAIIGIKGYSFPYFPYLSGIMKIKTALYSLFSRLDWHKTVVFPCLGEIYEGIRSLSWEIPVT